MSTHDTTDAGMDRANAQLEHAAEIEAAMKFALWLRDEGWITRDWTQEDLAVLAQRCFCGK